MDLEWKSSVKRGTPYPSPPHFVKKSLADMGGDPPFKRKKPKNFPKKLGQKGLQLAFFGQK